MTGMRTAPRLALTFLVSAAALAGLLPWSGPAAPASSPAASFPADPGHPSSRELELEILAGEPRSGDLLFRRGRSFLSRAVLATDAGGAFSHVGLVVETEEGLAVVHTVPGSGSGEGPLEGRGGARGEPLAAFLAPTKAEAAALYRIAGEDPDIARKAAIEALGYARDRVPFDDDFALEDGGRLYCTELVWTAFRAAGVDLVDGHFDDLKIPLHSGPYLLPSALQKSPHLTRITPDSQEERR